jgi:hypothetical protein
LLSPRIEVAVLIAFGDMPRGGTANTQAAYQSCEIAAKLLNGTLDNV